MSAVLMMPDGDKREVEPADRHGFTLAEVQAFVGGFVQLVRLTEGRLMLINEEAKFMPGMQPNPAATRLAHHVGAIRNTDWICGPALICDASQFR